MKRYTYMLGISLISAAFTGQAHATDIDWDETLSGIYSEVRAGAVFIDDSNNSGGLPDTEFDAGYTLGVAVGYGFDNRARFGHGPWNNVRVEGEVSYSEADIDGGAGNPEVGAIAYMANIYYDVDTGTRWKPFVGGGVGAATINLDGGGLRDDDDTVFAYQARAGLGYQLTDKSVVSLGYRFFDTAEPDFRTSTGTAFDSEFRSHSVEAGFRYNF